MRGLVLGLVVLLGAGIADAKPCAKGTSRIGKKCVIDRWPTRPAAAPKKAPIIFASLAVETKPTAGALYHAAQASRLAGDRASALELYDQYLLVAPTGPAAPAVRAQIEKLRADVQ